MTILNPVFVASCVFARDFPELSRTVQKYVIERFHMPIMRCCVKNYKTKEFENSMPDWLVADWKELPSYIHVSENNVLIYICHNCSAIFQEHMPNVPILSFWELVLNDDKFVYPDYFNEKITIQDCWRSYDNYAEQDAVRKLLKKMNVNIVEQNKNRETTDYCGTTLFSPSPVRNIKLAPKRFLDNAKGKFIPLDEEEKLIIMQNHCKTIDTEKVVVYCHYCVQGLKVGGKNGIHLADLLFNK